jgi:hypothetical protein
MAGAITTPPEDEVFEDGSEVEEEVEEVEEEVEEEDDDAEAAELVAPPKKKSSPGKVVPSKAVKDMAMGSPTSGPRVKKSLDPTRDPFSTVGDWTEKSFSEIKIIFTSLTHKNESTNDLTRENRPEARYWKGPISFNYSSFSSQTLRFNNVQIPYYGGKGYGSSFVYIGLPGFVGSAFADAGKVLRPTVVQERSLVPDPQRWWKIANNVEGCFGSLDGRTGKFFAKSLATIFASTGKGVTANIVVKFNVKASTDEKQVLKPATPCTIAVEVVRAYIASVNVDIPAPTKAVRTKAKIEPLATSSDVATDDLKRDLAAMGL